MRIVLDSNVYIAAFLNKGLASDILLLGEKGKVQLFTSSEIISEIKSILNKKFKINKADIDEFADLIKHCSQKVDPKQDLKVIKSDPEDNKILECAVEAKANLIVTMDKHLLNLKSYEITGIVHPKTLTWIIPQLFE